MFIELTFSPFQKSCYHVVTLALSRNFNVDMSLRDPLER